MVRSIGRGQTEECSTDGVQQQEMPDRLVLRHVTVLTFKCRLLDKSHAYRLWRIYWELTV